MSGSDDPIKFLVKLNNKINWLTSGKYGHPGLTIFSRLMLLLLVLGFCGPILWHGLIVMPFGLVVIITLGLLLRFALRYWRRSS
jgi:hypothetical protein